MTVRQLRTLIAVAESGSFSAAAERIFLTHAGVGQQMKALEEELGIELFDRSKRQPILTSQGRMIVDRARRVVRDYDALTHTEDDPGLAGDLSLGAVRTTLTALVPNALADMARSCPELSIYVVPGLTSQLVEQVERRGMDPDDQRTLAGISYSVLVGIAIAVVHDADVFRQADQGAQFCVGGAGVRSGRAPGAVGHRGAPLARVGKRHFPGRPSA